MEILAAHKDALVREHFVRELAIFGSVARDEAGPESDIDILVDFDRQVGLLHCGRLKVYLEGLLGRKVDLVETAALRPRIRERVLREAIHAA